jgi:hypothetical protein
MLPRVAAVEVAMRVPILFRRDTRRLLRGAVDLDGCCF